MAFDQAALQSAVLALLAQEPPQQVPPRATNADRVGPAPYLAAVGGTLADLGTTLDARSRGAREANPLAGSDTGSIIAVKGAEAVLMPLLMRYLAKQGHPTAAKALGYITGGIGGASAIHNAQVAR